MITLQLLLLRIGYLMPMSKYDFHPTFVWNFTVSVNTVYVRALAELSIIPSASNTYNTTKVLEALTAKYKVTPSLECRSSEVQEIHTQELDVLTGLVCFPV